MISPIPELPRPQVEETKEVSQLCAEAQYGEQLHLKQKGIEDESCPVHEKLWHILAAKCIALGLSIDETASIVEKHRNTIKVILRNPNFQARVIKYMEDNGTSMAEMFKQDALSARATLIEIHENEKLAPSARISAATYLIDRHLGKATQYIESKSQTISSDPHIREQELIKEIKTLRGSQDLIQDIADDRDTIALS